MQDKGGEMGRWSNRNDRLAPLYLLQRELVLPNRGQRQLVWGHQDKVTGANRIGTTGTGNHFKTDRQRDTKTMTCIRFQDGTPQVYNPLLCHFPPVEKRCFKTLDFDCTSKLADSRISYFHRDCTWHTWSLSTFLQGEQKWMNKQTKLIN